MFYTLPAVGEILDPRSAARLPPWVADSFPQRELVTASLLRVPR
jgi:hypothetical protein